MVGAGACAGRVRRNRAIPLGRARNGRARVCRQYTCTVYRVAWRMYVCYMYARSSGPTGRSAVTSANAL